MNQTRYHQGMIGLCALTVGAFTGGAHAQVAFSSDMDTSAGWTVNGDPDTTAVFGFDFTAAPYGIPPSPGGSTRGLQMKCNLINGIAATTVATPTGLGVSGDYVVEFDFWINANGPFPGGGTGSTEFLGGGVGYDGTTAGLSGASLIISGEGGAFQDWRLYKDDEEQFIASGQYDLDSNNASGMDLSAAFPGQPAPAPQVTAYPGQAGTLQDGSGGFAWHHMVITVSSTAGTANFTVDGLSIGTLNTNIGTPVETSGPLSVIYDDPFGSISDNTDMSFGIVDNYVVLRGPGQNYCLALANSSGNPAIMSSAGSNSVADQDLSLTAEGLPPGVSGIFYYGTTQLQQPFGDGFRCVGGMVQRLPFNAADGAGVLSEPDVFSLAMPNVPLVAGTFNFQAWYRDPSAMASGFNLSDGLEVLLTP